MSTDTRRFDVCNGDADGLCAVVQWRLHEPQPAWLVTGLKREIELVQRVHARPGDDVLVCDLSLRRNRAAVDRLLGEGARVRYFDHHASDVPPAHPRFEGHIDTRSDVCTSLLMDQHLGGRFRRWALVGAYGDNLTALADQMGEQIGLDAEARRTLQQLGEAINYNAYGTTESDVRIAPAALYGVLSRHADPLVLAASEPIVHELHTRRQSDLQQAMHTPPLWEDAHASVRVLPDAPWSRRVIGTFGNELATARPDRAHAVLLTTSSGFRVSVRAPLSAPEGADDLCHPFGGAGRAAAAGIDDLPADQRHRFVEAFVHARWQASPRNEKRPW